MAKTNKENNAAVGSAAVTLAEKQRLRLLLTKVKNDESLTKSELNELKLLESKYTSPSTGKSREKVAFAKDEVVETQVGAAQYAGVSERTIRRWVKSGMMRTERKFYIKSQLDIFKLNEGQAPNEHKVRATKATADVKEAQAALLNLELSNKQELFHSVEICRQRTSVQIQTVKRAVMGLGRNVSLQFPKKQRRKINAACNREARMICNKFAEGMVK